MAVSVRDTMETIKRIIHEDTLVMEDLDGQGISPLGVNERRLRLSTGNSILEAIYEYEAAVPTTIRSHEAQAES